MIKQEENKNSDVNKAIRLFVQEIKRDKNLKLSLGSITYKEFLTNRMLIVYAIHRGIPYSLFDHIKNRTPFNDKDWADVLNISTKSLQRYRNEENHIFKPIHSEKIIELAEVTNLGKEVFDSSEQFYLWLKTPSFALGNMKPIELLKDSYGKEMVVNELHRIDHGIFA